MKTLVVTSATAFLIVFSILSAQTKQDTIDTSGFGDSAHHWYDITDEVPKLIAPSPTQQKYKSKEIAKIADNILLYQRSNGGWPKNYDMRAILSEEQKQKIASTKDDCSLTTFDNGATHSQIEYLSRAYAATNDNRYKESCLKGIDFILSAQYPNGGFPQFYPDTSGYRKYITFNDGAMSGVMQVLDDILQNRPQYAFVDETRREKIRTAFDKGIDCILHCQIVVNDTLTAWCQQHDNIDFRPQNARTFEPKSICSLESAEIVKMLMAIQNPKKEVIEAVEAACQWFERSKIFGIRIDTIKTKKVDYKYHSADFDRIVVSDKNAPPMWARMYEIETNRPLFCGRSGKIVYSMSEIEPERRTGYKWYGYDAESVLKLYPKWKKRILSSKE